MEYFYHKALEGEGNETVKVDDFRYPGPKPRHRETAILMLADAVEAATRSVAKPTLSRIREITKQIIDKRMLSGQLDGCNLTLLDLARIREAFIPLLTGIHHARIAYPGQKEREPERSGERKEAAPRERRGERAVEVRDAGRGEPASDRRPEA
jgi:membrane-associated HD superfamily phosphohydrolase